MGLYLSADCCMVSVMDIDMYQIENRRLSSCTTLGLGGTPDAYYAVNVDDELIKALQHFEDTGEPFMFLGGGSNVVVSDLGVDGSVLSFKPPAQSPMFQGDDIVVEAGAIWDDFVSWSVGRGLAGVSCMSGIPGCVGAAPIQNIGAYGQEVGEVITWVEVVDLKTRQRSRMTAESCEFGYRDSIFKRSLKGRVVVTRVGFRLEARRTIKPRYAELKAALGDVATLESARAEVLKIRERKGMTLGHPFGFTSAGSFFMNPIVDSDALDRIRRAVDPGGRVPSWDMPNGRHKVAAAWLIETAGFHKGTRRGQVGISPKHALSLVNFGGGRTETLLSLALEIQQVVFDKFGVWLVMEPELVGKGLDAFRDLKRDTPE